MPSQIPLCFQSIARIFNPCNRFLVVIFSLHEQKQSFIVMGKLCGILRQPGYYIYRQRNEAMPKKLKYENYNNPSLECDCRSHTGCKSKFSGG